MTIHSDWSRLLHDECPEAFHADPPQKNPQVGVIDGHLQLMSLHRGLASWDAFVQHLFVKPVMQLFAAGCPRVVLCFDCYDHVPVYKSMTQTKRVNRKEVCVFNADQSLPPTIPDDPMLYLMNRAFKLKVVELVIERAPALILSKMHAEQEFILDYKRVVIFSHKDAIPRVMPELVPMGESDVKFCRYVDFYGNALVHAIDGDYLAIALLYYTQHEPGNGNRIHICRQLATFPEPASKANKKQKKEPAPKTEPIAKRKIVKCWVDVQMLYLTITQAMWQSAGRDTLLNAQTGAGFSDADAVHAAVFLMLMAGTDFSRSLPWLGPRRMWEYLPCIVASLMQAAAIDAPVENTVGMATDLVTAKLYRCIFEKHCGTGTSFDKTMSLLQHSGLSVSVRAKLPSKPQLVTTIQNVMWVMAYWKTHNGLIATPLDGSNGFERFEGNIMFSDMIAC